MLVPLKPKTVRAVETILALPHTLDLYSLSESEDTTVSYFVFAPPSVEVTARDRSLGSLGFLFSDVSFISMLRIIA